MSRRKPKIARTSSVRRLFIDPASCGTSCSGWALFEGLELVKSGIVHVEHKNNIFQRLMEIEETYRDLKFAKTPTEVHFELLPRRCHIYTHWSVGCIGAALWTPDVTLIKDDIAVTSWQKYCDWHGGKERLADHKGRQNDELAAIGMGLYYVNCKR